MKKKLIGTIKKVFIGITIALILLIAIAIGYGNKNSSFKTETEEEKAVELTKKIYAQKKNEGMDFKNGPCLSNNLMPDWVADIVYNPRKKIDKLPENQCSSYLEGKAHHFVEIDQHGNILKVQ